MMDRWVGKVAIVTGASAGIGEAVCEMLVNVGVKVVGLARREKVLKEVARRLRSKGEFHPLKADVSNKEQLTEAFQWVAKNLGPIYILVNSAGFNRTNNLIDGDTVKWKEVFDTNVMGLCVATKATIHNMMENKIDGHVIHINSIFGHSFTYFPALNVYPASKFAVTALTETLRQELASKGSKIKISSVSPGFVSSEFRKAAGFLDDPAQTKALMGSPEISPEDVADAVMYILGTPSHVQVHELIIKPIGESC